MFTYIIRRGGEELYRGHDGTEADKLFEDLQPADLPTYFFMKKSDNHPEVPIMVLHSKPRTCDTTDS